MKNLDKQEANQIFDAAKFLNSVSQSAGVYQMYNFKGRVLYIGKANNLKKRLQSYFNKNDLTLKLEKLVSQIASIEVSLAENGTEALILEQNLIKQHKPPYNVLLRDDKSYPYILLSGHKHPRLSVHRGAKTNQGHYFGPFPNAKAVRQTLDFLQKTFKLRQCDDAYYKNRSRPCLQYQIDRCLAPCCFEVDEPYLDAAEYTKLFLQGNSLALREQLIEKMEQASSALAFEQAALFRDKIQQLQYIQASQTADVGNNNIDLLAVVEKAGLLCVHCLYIRDGRIIGSKNHFLNVGNISTKASALEAFVSQYYFSAADFPSEIIVNLPLNDTVLLEQAFCSLAAKKVLIKTEVKGQRKKWLNLCERNAIENISLRLNTQTRDIERLKTLQVFLGLDYLPQRMECFDISHHGGDQAVASCVVFAQAEPLKKAYRSFNIKDITPGDDYAAISQAVTRRYRRMLDEHADDLPDIVFIDGGKGQLTAAHEALMSLGLSDLLVLGVSKGKLRKAGMEFIHFVDGRQVQIDIRSKALHLIQHIRDEAHRFALKQHKKRKRAAKKSPLEDIPGIGPKRRQLLLSYFGGVQQLQTASLDELCKVPNINQKTAEQIYQYFRKQ